MTYIQKGSRSFHKTSLAMFAGGFSTFALLYCMQPLMPEFSKDFGISPRHRQFVAVHVNYRHGDNDAVRWCFIGSKKDGKSSCAAP